MDAPRSGLSVADMKAAIERMTEAVKAAEAKAEEERAVRTPIAKKASPVSARADEKDKKKESPVSIIAGTPKSTDLIAERKADLGALPSLNALGGKSAAVECEDMIISPLASGMAKDAFITEVTPAASIPAKLNDRGGVEEKGVQAESELVGVVQAGGVRVSGVQGQGRPRGPLRRDVPYRGRGRIEASGTDEVARAGRVWTWRGGGGA